MVIEYNVRMGDPETEAVMPRIESDLVALMRAAALGDPGDMRLDISPKACVTVMTVSQGYPGSYPKGHIIDIADDINSDTIIFHAGTARDADGRLVTSGGRVIAVSSLGNDTADALSRSMEGVAKIGFDGKYYRRDIGQDLLSL